MKKRIILCISLVCGIFIISLYLCYGLVTWNAFGRTYDAVKDIPHNKFGLLLATSPITSGAAHNF